MIFWLFNRAGNGGFFLWAWRRCIVLKTCWKHVGRHNYPQVLRYLPLLCSTSGGYRQKEPAAGQCSATIDRINHAEGHCVSNIQILSHAENSAHKHIVGRGGKKQGSEDEAAAQTEQCRAGAYADPQ